MRNIILAAAIAFAALGVSLATADEFAGQNEQAATSAAVDRRASDSSFADPTAPSSLRSHGRP